MQARAARDAASRRRTTPPATCSRALPGRGERSILLCAHLDTVDDGGVPIEPVIVDGGWENANDGILGADNKAAVAVILELARRCSVEGSPGRARAAVHRRRGERAARAPRRSTPAQLRSEFGYVFDHATPIGEVVTASPTYFRLAAEFHGRAAHAGIRPEAGRSAILAAAHAIARDAARAHRRADDRQRRLDPGRRRVAPTSCPSAAGLLAETRSLDPSRVEDVVVAASSTPSTTAPPHAECDVDVVSERLFVGYRQKPSAPAIVAAEAALRACGYEPQRIVTGGGSDANALEAGGFTCVNLANGTERNHEPTERVAVAALEGMLDVALRAARRGGGGMSSAFEPVGAETKYEGKFFTVREETFRHEDGEESTREIVRHTGAVGVVCHDGESLWLVRQPREAVGDAGPAGDPGRQARRRGRGAAGDRQARAGRGDRQGRRASGSTCTRFFTSPGFTDEVCHVFLATGLSDAVGARRDEHERIDIEVRPLAELDAMIDEVRDSKTLIGLLELRRATAERRVAPAGRAAGGGEHLAVAIARPRPSRSSTSCSTSSPTSSSSAGCRATRSRPTAPTCSSSATGSSARAATRCTSTTPRSTEFVSELAEGRGDKPGAKPATLQRKVACLRSFHRHLRRQNLIEDDPTAKLKAPRQSRKLPQVLTRDEVAKLLAQPRGHRAGRAARPRAARGHVRLRPARLGGDRPRGRRPRPRGARPARPRQGLQGAARAGRHAPPRARSAPTSAAAARSWSATTTRRGCSSTTAATASRARGSTRSSSATRPPRGWRAR